MTGVGDWARDQDSSNRVFDEDDLRSVAIESKKNLSLVHELYDDLPFNRPKMTTAFGSSLKDMKSKMGAGNNSVITESLDIVNNSGNEDE